MTMKKYERVPPTERNKEGKLVLNLDCDEASENWLKYGRLKKLAEEDEEARKEVERMENNYYVHKAEKDDTV